MNHLKKIEDRVISILKTNVDARSDDMMLFSCVTAFTAMKTRLEKCHLRL